VVARARKFYHSTLKRLVLGLLSPESPSPIVIRLHLVLTASTTEADDASSDGGEDQHDERHPEGWTRGGMPTDGVHLVLDISKERNVDGEDDQCEESTEEGDERCDEGHGEMRTKAEQPSDEDDYSRNWVNDQPSRP